ncbi:hypothetical protein DFH11DRAFT_1785988 [Phellopilus nigrolimitatus]|nr:hypothetical protein DFH11DRAFT_1785988 [Phellopilus nigrolimitatus]
MSYDALPSYESIVAHLEQHLGFNPKPQEVLDVAKQLPQYEIDILVANAVQLEDLTPEQKADLHTGMVKTMSTPETETSLRTAATDAAAACNAIETMFSNLLRSLASIDAKNIPPKEGAFVPRFETLNQAFRRVVYDSKDLAINISVYSGRFDTVVIPICKDKELTTDQRKTKIAQFIKDADKFIKESDTMHEHFSKLKDDFAVFVGSFSGWAVDKEGADNDALKQARAELTVLLNELSNLKIALHAASAGAAAALPVTGVLGLMLTPFVAPIIIGGLVFAGLSTATVVGLAIAITSKKGEIKTKQTKIDDLVAAISEIRTAREKLQRLGSEDFTLFNNNISILSTLWASAHVDARKIEQWLESGANDADMPKYMQISINEAANAYKAMGVYLSDYAKGITPANIPKPSA